MANPFASRTGKARAFQNRVAPFTLAPMPPIPAGVMGSRPGDREGWQQFSMGLDTWCRQVSQQITELFSRDDADTITANIDAAVAAVQSSFTATIEAIQSSIASLQAMISALTARVADLEAIESVVRFEHTQTIPIDTWTIQHDQGKNPASIVLYENSGIQFSAQGVAQNLNRYIVRLGASYAGKAVLTF